MTEQAVLIGHRASEPGFPWVVHGDIKKALLQRGVRVVDFPSDRDPRAVTEIYRTEKIAFTFLMNFSAAGARGEHPHPPIAGKVVSWQQDNPFHVANRIGQAHAEQHWLCADEGALAYAHAYYGNPSSVAHFPHWATDIEMSARDVIEKPFKDRLHDILFVGSIDLNQKAMAERYIEESPETTRRYATNLLDVAMEEPVGPLTKHALEIQGGVGREFAASDPVVFCRVQAAVDIIIRARRRIELLQALRGLRVAVVSRSYLAFEEILGDNLIKIGPADFSTGLHAMENAKVVLNTLPNYGGGVTERFFNAQLRGAAVLSEGNGYLRRAFRENEEVLLYDPRSDLQDLADRLYAVLSDPSTEELAMAGRRVTQANHLARHRLEKLLELHPVL
jgi:hypothetical protein